MNAPCNPFWRIYRRHAGVRGANKCCGALRRVLQDKPLITNVYFHSATVQRRQRHLPRICTGAREGRGRRRGAAHHLLRARVPVASVALLHMNNYLYISISYDATLPATVGHGEGGRCCTASLPRRDGIKYWRLFNGLGLNGVFGARARPISEPAVSELAPALYRADRGRSWAPEPASGSIVSDQRVSRGAGDWSKSKASAIRRKAIDFQCISPEKAQVKGTMRHLSAWQGGDRGGVRREAPPPSPAGGTPPSATAPLFRLPLSGTRRGRPEPSIWRPGETLRRLHPGCGARGSNPAKPKLWAGGDTGGGHG